jgi:hypothetical protein
VAKAVAVYLEVGSKRVFAGALDWPGWCRSGRDEDVALQALVAYGPRYATAMGSAVRELELPADRSAIDVVERLRGDATTDFGAPGVAAAADDRSLKDAELKRLTGLLRASWRKFDRTARAARGTELRKGPRGGGRELEALVMHVLEADGAYLSRLGESFKRSPEAAMEDEVKRLRTSVLGALSDRAHGVPPPPSRRRSRLWTPRFAIRRSAWHALDHAWEIEDRTAPRANKA